MCAKPSFQRAFPRSAAALAGLLFLYAVIIAYLALSSPRHLHLAAAVAGGALVWAWWRGRPDYGRSRGLPPGSLAIVSSLDSLLDHLFYRKLAIRHGPVFKTSQFHHPMACIVGLDQAIAVLRQHDDVLAVPPLPFSRFIPDGFLRYMAPAEHRTHQRIFKSALSREVIEQCEPFIIHTVRQELYRMAESSRTIATGVWPRPHLDSMVFTIWARLFFDVLPDTESFARLQSLYPVINPRKVSRASSRKIVAALEEITEILHAQIVRFSRELKHGRAPSCFLAEVLRSNPTAVDDQTVLRNLIFMMQTTKGDVTGLLSWILKMLSDHPVWVVKVREERRAGEGGEARLDGLAGRIVMETLRLEQSEFLYRRTKQEIKVGDYMVPEGWLLRICVRESHRDARVFEDPDTFDPDRFLGRDCARTEYSPFGASRIACLGENLTKTVGRVFVDEISRGFDWRVVNDGPREFGGRHWYHWKPSSKFRVSITPRL